jgi:hypothetical protein
MVQDIADAAQIAAPMIDFDARRVPWGQEKPVERDPDRNLVWDAYVVADFEASNSAAKAAGRRRPDRLHIVLGLGGATFWGGDGSMRLLYEAFRGKTVLMVGNETAWNEQSWGEAETWAGSYGPVHRLSELRDRVKGVSDFLVSISSSAIGRDASASGGHGPEPEPLVDALAPADISQPNGAEAFLAAQGVEALRALCTDGRSVESKRFKALARAQGIGPGTLYRAAQRLGDEAIASSELPFREATADDQLILYGYAAVFNQWRETNTAELAGG